ncbi:response regulator [bacterium]|nr:response regulator [bacterium]
MGASPNRIDPSRVLLVDQPGPELEQIVQCLKEYHLTAIMADTAAEALTYCEQQDIQLLVSERTLPDMDGFDFFRQVREIARTKDLPIIVLTREIDLDERIKSMSQDVDDYILKPFYPEEVAARVNTVLLESLRSADGSLGADCPLAGRLEDMTLLSLLQLLVRGKKTGRILLSVDPQPNHIIINDGSIWDAQWGRAQGENALIKLLLQSSGGFRVQLQPEILEESTIPYPAAEVLRWGAELLDAGRRLTALIPSLETVLASAETALQSRELSESEYGWIRHLQHPQTIASLLHQLETAGQTLTTCRTLLEKKLIVIADTAAGRLTDVPQSTTKRSKDRPSLLTVFFRKRSNKSS